jgi:probable phosphoglycerate mutase
MRVFLIRHGRTAWNAKGLFQGTKDIPLDETGLFQAEAMAKKAEQIPLDAVWSSPLLRALETARALAIKKDLEVRVHEGLREIEHGEWEGLDTRTVNSRWPGLLDLWHERPDEVVMPGGESLENVRVRVLEAMDVVFDKGGESVAVVSHDAVIKVLLCSWLGLPLGAFWRFDIANGSITGVEKNEAGFHLFLLGDLSWSENPYERERQTSL